MLIVTWNITGVKSLTKVHFWVPDGSQHEQRLQRKGRVY